MYKRIIIGTLALLALYGADSTANYTSRSPPTYLHLISILHRKQPKLTPQQTKPIAQAVQTNAKLHNFPPELIIAIMEKESSLLPRSTSTAQCVGLMQINPRAHPDRCEKFSRKELYSIDVNVQIGCAILKEYYDRTGNITDALYRYRGAKDAYYVNRILSSFADEIILKR